MVVVVGIADAGYLLSMFVTNAEFVPTTLVEHFDDAATLAAAYVADQINDGGRTATYWEVKNESTIKSEFSSLQTYEVQNSTDCLTRKLSKTTPQLLNE